MALEGRREQDEAFKARLSGYTEGIKAELKKRGIPITTANKTGLEREVQLRKRLVLALDRGTHGEYGWGLYVWLERTHVPVCFTQRVVNSGASPSQLRRNGRTFPRALDRG